MLSKKYKMNQNTTDTLSELEEFVEQQAHEDASLPAGEKRHQAQVVKDVLNDQVASPKTLKRLLDEYMAGCALPRTKILK